MTRRESAPPCVLKSSEVPLFWALKLRRALLLQTHRVESLRVPHHVGRASESRDKEATQGGPRGDTEEKDDRAD